MPLSGEMPAPVKTTMCRAIFKSFIMVTSKIAIFSVNDPLNTANIPALNWAQGLPNFNE
jgi:hypothetical protein